MTPTITIEELIELRARANRLLEMSYDKKAQISKRHLRMVLALCDELEEVRR